MNTFPIVGTCAPPGTTFVERAQVDKFYRESLIPQPLKRPGQAQTAHNPTVLFPFQRFADGWQSDLEQPMRKIARTSPATADGSVFNFTVAFNLYPDRYQSPNIQITHRRRGLDVRTAAAQTTTFPERVQSDKWWAPFVEPTRRTKYAGVYPGVIQTLLPITQHFPPASLYKFKAFVRRALNVKAWVTRDRSFKVFR